MPFLLFLLGLYEKVAPSAKIFCKYCEQKKVQVSHPLPSSAVEKTTVPTAETKGFIADFMKTQSISEDEWKQVTEFADMLTKVAKLLMNQLM